MLIDIYGLVTWWESHRHLPTATPPITAGPTLALESHCHLLFKWTNLYWMDFLALWAGKYYLENAAEWSSMALLSVNCTCTLLRTLKEVVFMASGHFAPFCAVACCKKSKYSLLSSDLLLLSLTTVFFLLFLPDSSWFHCLFLWGVQVSKTRFVHSPGRGEQISQYSNKDRIVMWAQLLLGIRNSTLERIFEGSPDAEKASQFLLSYKTQKGNGALIWSYLLY